jgi:excinuclease UvrABC helicase subunit UvrB
VQAAALAILEKHGPERAIGEINLGLEKFAALYQSYDAPEKFDDDEMVQRLKELQESLREHYKIGRTLDEQLADAVATEQYELAAQLRDEIAKRQFKAH